MKLIEPTMAYDRQIQAYRREFLEYGGSMDGCGSLRRFDRTQDWLDQIEAFRRPETTPPVTKIYLLILPTSTKTKYRQKTKRETAGAQLSCETPLSLNSYSLCRFLKKVNEKNLH